MKDYSDFVDDLPIGVSRNVIKFSRRFRESNRTTSASSVPHWTERYDDESEWFETSHPRTRTYRASQSKLFATTIRGRAACKALNYSWKFVRNQQRVCDVDTVRYPFELLRYELLSNAERNREEDLYQRHYWQPCEHQWQQQWQPDGQHQWLVQQRQAPIPSTCFLDCFDENCIDRRVRELREITVAGSLSMRASFGRTLYHLNAHRADRSYKLSDLAQTRYPCDVQSRWSNVCDDDAPVMQALIGELNRADSDVDLGG